MNNTTLNKSQLNVLVFMRILIGWHFLYEGVIKVYNPSWTSKAYLLSSEGIFKSMFVKLASDSLVGFVDGMNIAILLVVGMFLILGVLAKQASLLGAILLLLFYLSHPAFPGFNQAIEHEGMNLQLNFTRYAYAPVPTEIDFKSPNIQGFFFAGDSIWAVGNPMSDKCFQIAFPLCERVLDYIQNRS